MCACEAGRILAATAALTGMTIRTAAADPRIDLLAAEASRLAVPGGASAAASVSWELIAVMLLGTMAAAFAGTYVGARRFTHVRGPDGWRELTYRFRSGTPLRLKTDTLRRLSGVLGELEEIGSDLRMKREETGPTKDSAASAPDNATTPAAPRVDEARDVTFRRRAPLPGGTTPPADAPRAATEPMRARARERRTAYERARRLLREGADPAAVREMTGLKAVEVDLLRAAPGTGPADPSVRRGRAHLNLRLDRSSGGER